MLNTPLAPLPSREVSYDPRTAFLKQIFHSFADKYRWIYTSLELKKLHFINIFGARVTQNLAKIFLLYVMFFYYILSTRIKRMLLNVIIIFVKCNIIFLLFVHSQVAIA